MVNHPECVFLGWNACVPNFGVIMLGSFYGGIGEWCSVWCQKCSRTWGGDDQAYFVYMKCLCPLKNSIQFQFHSWCQSHWRWGWNNGVGSHNVYLDEMLESSTFHPQWWDHLSRQGREADKTKCTIESKVKITTRVFLILWYNYTGESSTRGISQIWLRVREESRKF